MPLLTGSCATCGVSVCRVMSTSRLEARDGQTVYCSVACRRTGHLSACAACGSPIYVKQSTASRRPSRWCSRACSDAGRKRGERRECARCGEPFYVFPSELTKQGRANLYCSRACGNAASAVIRTGLKRTDETRAKISRVRAGVPIPKLRKPPIVHLCHQCSAPFEVSRSRPTPQLAKFCSTDCWLAYVRLTPSALGAYRGGAHPYYGPDWRSQARKARERDRHTCRNCGLHQFNPRLDVHHIVPRRLFGNDYRSANQLENLISLCKPCHTALERAMTKEMRS